MLLDILNRRILLLKLQYNTIQLYIFWHINCTYYYESVFLSTVYICLCNLLTLYYIKRTKEFIYDKIDIMICCIDRDIDFFQSNICTNQLWKILTELHTGI